MPITSSISSLARSGSACGRVHLVEHRHHLDAEVEGGVAVGDRLRLDTLARIDHQQRPLAGRQRAAHFIGEVDVPRRVDQVQVVDAAVARRVLQRRRLGLDGDAALALDVHGIEHLRLHLAIAQAAAALDDAVGQRALAVVDVGNDGEISDVIHADRSRRLPRCWQRHAVVAAGAHIVGDMRARGAVRKLKKRHVEVVTRLPTKRMATACWAFIVAKSTPPQTAPLLDFFPLRAPNMKIHPQLIHKSMWTSWG
jgi:hypothetical protein